MLAPFLTAIITGAAPEDPPRILGDPSSPSTPCARRCPSATTSSPSASTPKPGKRRLPRRMGPLEPRRAAGHPQQPAPITG